jgi:hypothetical protein
MAEDCSLAAGEDRCSEATAKRQAWMADRVDAAVQAVQAAAANADGDRVVVHAARSKLVDRQHSVALGRQACDPRVAGCVVLLGRGPSRSTHHERMVLRSV